MMDGTTDLTVSDAEIIIIYISYTGTLLLIFNYLTGFMPYIGRV